MTKIKSSIKEAAGYTEEEFGEMIGSRKIAHEGRNLRNEGRVEKGKSPKWSEPGEGKK